MRSGGRLAACAFIALFVLFVSACSVVLVQTVFKMESVLETIDVKPITKHIHAVLNEAHEAAQTHRAFGADLREALATAAPALLEAVNATKHAAGEADRLATHPTFTISAAG